LILFLSISYSEKLIPEDKRFSSACKNKFSSTNGIKIDASHGKVLPFKSISKSSGKYYLSSP
jgi:hypothetical protein